MESTILGGSTSIDIMPSALALAIAVANASGRSIGSSSSGSGCRSSRSRGAGGDCAYARDAITRAVDGSGSGNSGM